MALGLVQCLSSSVLLLSCKMYGRGVSYGGSKRALLPSCFVSTAGIAVLGDVTHVETRQVNTAAVVKSTPRPIARFSTVSLLHCVRPKHPLTSMNGTRVLRFRNITTSAECYWVAGSVVSSEHLIHAGNVVSHLRL